MEIENGDLRSRTRKVLLSHQAGPAPAASAGPTTPGDEADKVRAGR